MRKKKHWHRERNRERRKEWEWEGFKDRLRESLRERHAVYEVLTN